MQTQGIICKLLKLQQKSIIVSNHNTRRGISELNCRGTRIGGLTEDCRSPPEIHSVSASHRPPGNGIRVCHLNPVIIHDLLQTLNPAEIPRWIPGEQLLTDACSKPRNKIGIFSAAGLQINCAETTRLAWQKNMEHQFTTLWWSEVSMLLLLRAECKPLTYRHIKSTCHF